MTVRLAAAADLHVGVDTAGRLNAALCTVNEAADLLLLGGDLTRVGNDEEAECVVAELSCVTIPVVAVLGNHDHHADRGEHLVERLTAAGVSVLEGDTFTVDVRGTTVGVAGVKGFGGGFAGRSASEFGEPEMKAFVRHAAASARRLGDALQALRTDVRVALLHYSPIPDTLAGEPPEIYPFLGSYLFAESIDRAGADLALHGHAHHGSERGVTPGGVRVRNVAQPVIRAPYRVYELR